jgi:hypothetical protein
MTFPAHPRHPLCQRNDNLAFRRFERADDLNRNIFGRKHHPLGFTERLRVSNPVIVPPAGQAEVLPSFPIPTGNGEPVFVIGNIMDLEFTRVTNHITPFVIFVALQVPVTTALPFRQGEDKLTHQASMRKEERPRKGKRTASRNLAHLLMYLLGTPVRVTHQF